MFPFLLREPEYIKLETNMLNIGLVKFIDYTVIYTPNISMYSVKARTEKTNLAIQNILNTIRS